MKLLFNFSVKILLEKRYPTLRGFELRDVALQDTKLDSSWSDKEARKFVEEHIAVKEDRYEIPVPLKKGVDTMPDNLVMAR